MQRSPTATWCACIFPKGKITFDGELSAFSQGVQKIVERVPVPVIPMALRGLWGSLFSRYGGAAFSRPIDARQRRGLRSRVDLVVGTPLPPEVVTPERLMAHVAALRGGEP